MPRNAPARPERHPVCISLDDHVGEQFTIEYEDHGTLKRLTGELLYRPHDESFYFGTRDNFALLYLNHTHLGSATERVVAIHDAQDTEIYRLTP